MTRTPLHPPFLHGNVSAMADIDISTEVMRRAAHEADSVADTVGTAQSAATQALPDNAFGLMCSPLFLPLYTPVAVAAQQMMASSVRALNHSADQLRQSAQAFETNDDDLVALLRSNW